MLVPETSIYKIAIQWLDVIVNDFDDNHDAIVLLSGVLAGHLENQEKYPAPVLAACHQLILLINNPSACDVISGGKFDIQRTGIRKEAIKALVEERISYLKREVLTSSATSKVTELKENQKSVAGDVFDDFKKMRDTDSVEYISLLLTLMRDYKVLKLDPKEIIKYILPLLSPYESKRIPPRELRRFVVSYLSDLDAAGSLSSLRGGPNLLSQTCVAVYLLGRIEQYGDLLKHLQDNLLVTVLLGYQASMQADSSIRDEIRADQGELVFSWERDVRVAINSISLLISMPGSNPRLMEVINAVLYYDFPKFNTVAFCVNESVLRNKLNLEIVSLSYSLDILIAEFHFSSPDRKMQLAKKLANELSNPLKYSAGLLRADLEESAVARYFYLWIRVNRLIYGSRNTMLEERFNLLEGHNLNIADLAGLVKLHPPLGAAFARRSYSTDDMNWCGAYDHALSQANYMQLHMAIVDFISLLPAGEGFAGALGSNLVTVSLDNDDDVVEDNNPFMQACGDMIFDYSADVPGSVHSDHSDHSDTEYPAESIDLGLQSVDSNAGLITKTADYNIFELPKTQYGQYVNAFCAEWMIYYRLDTILSLEPHSQGKQRTDRQEDFLGWVLMAAIKYKNVARLILAKKDFFDNSVNHMDRFSPAQIENLKNGQPDVWSLMHAQHEAVGKKIIKTFSLIYQIVTSAATRKHPSLNLTGDVFSVISTLAKTNSLIVQECFNMTRQFYLEEDNYILKQFAGFRQNPRLSTQGVAVFSFLHNISYVSQDGPKKSKVRPNFEKLNSLNDTSQPLTRNSVYEKINEYLSSCEPDSRSGRLLAQIGKLIDRLEAEPSVDLPVSGIGVARL